LTGHLLPSSFDDRGAPLGRPALQESIADALADARRRDTPGHWAHVAAAVIYVGTLATITNVVTWTFVVLSLIALIRLPHTYRTYRLLRRDQLGWLLVAFTLWHVASLLWSPDVSIKMVRAELGAFRVFVTPLLLWPVIDYVAWMIAAFLVGICVQNFVQLGQAVGWIDRELGDHDRLRGLVHPIMTGTLLTIGMCWHISAILLGRSRLRALCLFGLIAAGVGLVFTGSRGPWLAAAIVVPSSIVIIALRHPSARKAALLLACAGVIGAAAAWPLAGDMIVHRFQRTQRDLDRVERGRYAGDVGYRLASWDTAWNLFLEAPIIGQGAGGYGEGVQRSEHADVLKADTHAHSVYLHTLASTGAIGGLLLSAIVIGGLARAWRDRVDHPFAAGTLFALLAWLIAGIFDASHLNGQMLGVLSAMITITLPLRTPAQPLRIDRGAAPLPVSSA
jgi:O-antigen ligase